MNPIPCRAVSETAMTGEPLQTASAATGAPDIAANLALVKARIADAARGVGRAHTMTSPWSP